MINGTPKRSAGIATSQLDHAYIMEIKKTLKLMVHPTPASHDSDDVIWVDEKKQGHGYGYRSKEDGRVCVIRCPMCDTENYALNVPSGTCYRCGFDANYKDPKTA